MSAYLKNTNDHFYGVIGTPTNLVSDKGEPLFVGDIVHSTENKNGYVTTVHVVVKDGDSPAFVMGLHGAYEETLYENAPEFGTENEIGEDLFYQWKDTTPSANWWCEKWKDHSKLIVGEFIPGNEDWRNAEQFGFVVVTDEKRGD